ncbi:hypothetical protein [Methanobacterium sp.]|uniref:hypothetical protein n=1 Tax=Methanobacterium sp. TaxID=2164 RepID=UPI0026003AF8|nr:hypothetical protein [Methanobacterium sp.]MBI5460200.1 hypothetical protein [Methanobacterium sp.]
MARDHVGNTNQTPLTFTVDNTPPVINPEITPESVNPEETINITVTASPDTQSVVAIIGAQRINLTPTNGTRTWTTNYTIPLDATFNIHTIQIEGTDQVGNVSKNMASYEVLDPNPNPGPEPNPGSNPGPGPGPEPEPIPSPSNTATT